MKIDRDIKYAIETYIDATEKKYFIDSLDFDSKYSYDQFVKIELRTENAEEFDQKTLPIANANSNENIDKKLEAFHTKMKIVSSKIEMQGLPNNQKTDYAVAMRNKVVQETQKLDLLIGDAALVRPQATAVTATNVIVAPKVEKEIEKDTRDTKEKMTGKTTGMN
jgi:hypothetical protein